MTDLSGKSVYGIHSIKRLKRAYFKVAHKNATNITDIKEAIRTLKEARKQDPESIRPAPEVMFCLSDGTEPDNVGLEDKITTEETPKSDIDLTLYCASS